jgi:ATP-dependent exoDNAse (exonuclease V) alpha subunit
MHTAIPERRAATEEISGLIERVTFHNEESGFCVLRVKARGQRDETTVIGSLPSVTAGEWLSAEGWWVRDKEHGLQFKATTMKTVPPTTAEGIERYLGSGLVKGIGPILAKKLVGRFGAEVLAVIENRAAELQTVDGIGPKRRERIQEDNRCEDAGRTQDTGSGKKPERGYVGICTRRTESEGRAIGRFTGIVQHRRCRFGKCVRVDRARKRVRGRCSGGRRTRW